MMTEGLTKSLEVLFGTGDEEVEGFIWASDGVKTLAERFCFLRGERYVDLSAVWKKKVSKPSPSVMMVVVIG
jgi:hypothetical protein